MESTDKDLLEENTSKEAEVKQETKVNSTVDIDGLLKLLISEVTEAIKTSSSNNVEVNDAKLNSLDDLKNLIASTLKNSESKINELKKDLENMKNTTSINEYLSEKYEKFPKLKEITKMYVENNTFTTLEATKAIIEPLISTGLVKEVDKDVPPALAGNTKQVDVLDNYSTNNSKKDTTKTVYEFLGIDDTYSKDIKI